MIFADTTYTASLVPFFIIGLLTFGIGVLSGLSIASKRRKK